ncbi:unnamed protein product [Adineta steineri]|uniref:Uncharacterized protein n=1 Tax=Adineta steineri TaxID=433720 RepID=A0A815DBE2_9BILA|nr:unnamed protein product [Adineta steineri]CAF1511161.1 unnamed protein product [Adineta steineri]
MSQQNQMEEHVGVVVVMMVVLLMIGMFIKCCWRRADPRRPHPRPHYMPIPHLPGIWVERDPAYVRARGGPSHIQTGGTEIAIDRAYK